MSQKTNNSGVDLIVIGGSCGSLEAVINIFVLLANVLKSIADCNAPHHRNYKIPTGSTRCLNAATRHCPKKC